MSDAVFVSIIGGGFSVAVALLEMTRRQNNRDHGRNAERLDDLLINVQRLEKKTDRYGDRLRRHMTNDHETPATRTRKPAQPRKNKQ